MTTSPSPPSTQAKVAIIGGALDPITLGHLKLAQTILKSNRFDEVWLMPCYNHLFGKKLAPAEDRLEMCRLTTQGTDIKVSDWEIARKHTGTTYSTLKELKRENPKKLFYWVIGLDNVDQVPNWGDAEKLLKEFAFVVVPRGGVPLPKTEWHLGLPHIYLKNAGMSSISSTRFRTMYERGDPEAWTTVHPDVYSYVRNHQHLYKTPLSTGYTYCSIHDVVERLFYGFPHGCELPDDAEFDLQFDESHRAFIGIFTAGEFLPLWGVYAPTLRARVEIRMRLEKACEYLNFKVHPLNNEPECP